MPTWKIQSDSKMKYTKDVLANFPSTEFIDKQTSKSIELGSNMIDVVWVIPDKRSNALVRRFVDSARKKGLNIWFRFAGSAFEGIYGIKQHRSPDGHRHFKNITTCIFENSDLFLPGDMITPEAEPQNGGITGVNRGPKDFAQFINAAEFNEWIRQATLITRIALDANDIRGVKVGGWGFDGFITFGNDNPDWAGKSFLESATVESMDNIIAIDHYPKKETMAKDLDDFHAVWPNAQLIISEYGAINGESPEVVKAALETMKRPYVIGVNYWHMGPGGKEALVNSDFTNTPYFDVVKFYYK